MPMPMKSKEMQEIENSVSIIEKIMRPYLRAKQKNLNMLVNRLEENDSITPNVITMAFVLARAVKQETDNKVDYLKWYMAQKQAQK
jgi:hypothetical protein